MSALLTLHRGHGRTRADPLTVSAPDLPLAILPQALEQADTLRLNLLSDLAPSRYAAARSTESPSPSIRIRTASRWCAARFWRSPWTMMPQSGPRPAGSSSTVTTIDCFGGYSSDRSESAARAGRRKRALLELRDAIPRDATTITISTAAAGVAVDSRVPSRRYGPRRGMTDRRAGSAAAHSRRFAGYRNRLHPSSISRLYGAWLGLRGQHVPKPAWDGCGIAPGRARRRRIVCGGCVLRRCNRRCRRCHRRRLRMDGSGTRAGHQREFGRSREIFCSNES